MSLWTWFGLHEGNASTTWPAQDGADGERGLLGMPRFDPQRCAPACRACEEACVTRAIAFAPGDAKDAPPSVDWGRCIVCQRCAEVCPTGAFVPSNDWAVAVRRRDDLKWDAHADAPGDDAPGAAAPGAASGADTLGVAAAGAPDADAAGAAAPATFRRSLHIRHVDAGSCNGCESELQALNNPFFNLHRLGIFFTASPRFADVLLVTGPVTLGMHGPLLETYEAMPAPKWVIATGTCAVSGGVSGGNYACGAGLDGVLPVDIYLPGCPPNPAALIQALLMLVGRMPQRMKGGRLVR